MGKASLLPFTGICFLMFDYSDCTFVYQNRKSSMFQQCHPCYFPLSFKSFCFRWWTAVGLNLYSYSRMIYQIRWDCKLFLLQFMHIITKIMSLHTQTATQSAENQCKIYQILCFVFCRWDQLWTPFEILKPGRKQWAPTTQSLQAGEGFWVKALTQWINRVKIITSQCLSVSGINLSIKKKTWR